MHAFRPRLVASLATASLAVVGLAGAGVGHWGPLHGPEGGDVEALAVDPRNSEIVYAATGHGIFKTTNGGRAWGAVNAGLTSLRVNVLGIDPRTPSIVYAGTFYGGRIFKSTNGGLTWRASDRGLAEALREKDVDALAIDPKMPSTIYAASFGAGVFNTTNGGRSWRAVNTGIRKGVLALAIDPQQPATVYAGTGTPGGRSPHIGTVFKTTNGGRSWLAVGNGLTGADISALAIDPTTPTTIYAGASFGDAGARLGVFKSTDGGESWTGTGVLAQVTTLAIDPGSPETLYAGALDGVLKSADGGLTWNRVGTGLPSGQWTDALAVAPGRPAALYASAGDYGVFKTTSGGDPWRAVNSGLVGRRIWSLAVDPLDSRTVYAGTAGGVYRSSDGGAAWEAARLPKAPLVTALAIDPLRPSRVYAGGWGGVYRSTDGGRTWIAATTQLVERGVSAVAVDPRVTSTIYASTFNGWFPPATWRFVKSTDGGRSWRELTPGLSGKWVGWIAIDPRNTRTLYAATLPVFRNDRLVGGGVFKSVNGGRSWRAAGLPKMRVSALVADPRTPEILYALTDRGVFKSTDGSHTWRRAGHGVRSSVIAFTGALVIDPRSPATLYATACTNIACEGGQGVFRSTDGARSWRAFNQGLPTLDVFTVAIDSTGRTLYAGTSAGVFDYRFAR